MRARVTTSVGIIEFIAIYNSIGLVGEEESYTSGNAFDLTFGGSTSTFDINTLRVDSTGIFSITDIEFAVKVCSSSSSSSRSSSSSSTSAAAPPALGPNTLFDFTLYGSTSITTRNRINSAVFSAPTTTVRFTMAGVGYPGGSSTDVMIITDMYVGEAFEPSVSNDTAIDFAGPPTQVTFNDGTSNITLMPQTAYVSDIISYSHDHTKDMMVSIHFGGGTGCTVTTETFTLVPFHGTGQQRKFSVNEASVVEGVPIDSSAFKGLDALLSTVQMPPGIPVATVAVGSGGAKNAGVLAAQILALKYPAVAGKLKDYRAGITNKAKEKADAWTEGR